jgi:hypothetical protein
MKTNWLLFRIICFLQMLAATYFSFASLINYFGHGNAVNLLAIIAFTLIASFAIFALNLLNTNYPDKPVAGKQKSVFNWLFLLNFLVIAFLFAYFFSGYRMLRSLSTLMNRPVSSLPFQFWWPTVVFMIMIIFQFILLYGMYSLRRLLYLNFFSHQQFEFEDQRRD